ncbi:34650_t:CDS:2 [Gigaspora margarita]|uniref:34650_t:CDS:1 n=1 Tax=Gigaspora margarita TaxID=4874 RepID=A0ABM8VWB2_GIGMA|nr:34650_t:CDS:2 [Gigaspora margarita]
MLKKVKEKVHYNAKNAHGECSVIDLNWDSNSLQLHTNSSSKVFLEATLRKNVLSYIELHFHLHALIPTSAKKFITSPQEFGKRYPFITKAEESVWKTIRKLVSNNNLQTNLMEKLTASENSNVMKS